MLEPDAQHISLTRTSGIPIVLLDVLAMVTMSGVSLSNYENDISYRRVSLLVCGWTLHTPVTRLLAKREDV